MKHRRTTEELDALLGRGGLSPTRRDVVLEAVVNHVKRERSGRSWWGWSFAGLGAAAAAAVALLLVAPWRPSQTTAESSLRAKGSALPNRATAPAVEIGCSESTLQACPFGSLLVIRAIGVRGFVGAWAEPVGGGERIWYFSAETTSPMVDGVAPDSTAASRAVKIGPEHSAGTYAVEIRVTDRPMGHADLLRLSPTAALAIGRASLTVTSP